MITPKQILIPRASTSSDLFRESSTRSLRQTDIKRSDDFEKQRPSPSLATTSSSPSLSQNWLDLTSFDDLDQSKVSESLRKVVRVSRALTLPAIFADSGWKTDAQNFAALSNWTNRQAADLLNTLAEALDAFSDEFASTSSSEDLTTEDISPRDLIIKRALLSAIVAAVRFIPPTELSVLHLGTEDPNRVSIDNAAKSTPYSSKESDWANPKNGFDPWMTRRNVEAAKKVISHSIFSPSETKFKSANARVDHYDLAMNLLSSHIKPLFVSHLSNSSKLNSETSRPVHRDPNLPKTMAMGNHAPSAGDVVWKGGALDREGKRFLINLEEKASDSISSTDANRLKDRNQAIGCWNVLAWCIISIARAQVSIPTLTKKEERPWETSFHLVLPPLLALMDDSSPQFRCIGATILARCALRSFEGQKEADAFQRLGSIPSQLLIRTGVSSLFLDSLESSMTYTNDERDGSGSRLLDASLRASRSLILLTTFNPEFDSSSAFNPLEDDGGLKQTFKLHHLVVEGILKVWSYLPSIPSAFTTSERQRSLHSTLRITFCWLGILSSDLGIFSSRFSGLSIEFLASQLDLDFDDLKEELASSSSTSSSSSSIEKGNRNGEEPFWKNLDEKIITCISASVTLRKLLLSLFSGHDSQSDNSPQVDSIPASIPPSLVLWAEKIIVACARCWVQLKDIEHYVAEAGMDFVSLQRKQLGDGLKEILLVLEGSKSSKMEEHFSRLGNLDAETFGPLLPTPAAPSGEGKR